MKKTLLTICATILASTLFPIPAKSQQDIIFDCKNKCYIEVFNNVDCRKNKPNKPSIGTGQSTQTLSLYDIIDLYKLSLDNENEFGIQISSYGYYCFEPSGEIKVYKLK